MSKYGETGTHYQIDDNEFFVDEKFIVSTLMAIVFALREIHEKDMPNLDGAIEQLAGNIYEELKLADPFGTTKVTGEGTE
jgi:hypothetical protein